MPTHLLVRRVHPKIRTEPLHACRRRAMPVQRICRSVPGVLPTSFVSCSIQSEQAEWPPFVWAGPTFWPNDVCRRLRILVEDAICLHVGSISRRHMKRQRLQCLQQTAPGWHRRHTHAKPTFVAPPPTALRARFIMLRPAQGQRRARRRPERQMSGGKNTADGSAARRRRIQILKYHCTPERPPAGSRMRVGGRGMSKDWNRTRSLQAVRP